MTVPRPQARPARDLPEAGPVDAGHAEAGENGARHDPGRPDALRVAELTCARLCHDIGGPLGTLGHALEMAEEEAVPGAPTLGRPSLAPPSLAPPSLALAQEAAAAMVAQLRLLRAAWAGDGAVLDRDALADLAARPLRARRVGLDLSGVPEGIALAPASARAVLNLLLLGADGLPGGGLLSLSGDAGGQGGMMLRIAGARAAWPAGLARTLHDPDGAWRALDDPRLVQAPLAALAARAAGLRLLLAQGADPVPLLLERDRPNRDRPRP